MEVDGSDDFPFQWIFAFQPLIFRGVKDLGPSQYVLACESPPRILAFKQDQDDGESGTPELNLDLPL